MMQITEDTPPDMLAGAMDLTVHLPNGDAVKMSVERSTPMMDLLVQITTANHLQLSNHTLQALGMAPSSENSDRLLPFKPNTPIGALDTQHVRVLPKGRTLPAPKYTAPGHQPFESTFRLKVHLPRNQLYVTRVSRNVLLEDIMKKVCEEKNLDPQKYEFKHPGNLDQVLDPKLTLSDYQITEIYVVVKGTTNLSQAFSAADIMVLRKEEERKQMHTKTGGGVFNLIFKRGKSSMGSGSVSSDNRSISPTHSDDSRSVTPPAVQAPPIVAPPKKDPPPDRPKPPQRKRRPAPKPPQIHVAEVSNESGAEKSSSVISNEDPTDPLSQRASENGLTICHSRNSSDSSGYHEASVLSDHCANTSLPRTRPKSAFVGDQVPLQSTSNLSKMSLHSRSTTSLGAGRKKKAAPPPPPIPVSPANSVVAQSEKPSPLVASQSDISTHKESSEVLETSLTPIINPIPKPRSRTKVPIAPPRSRPSSGEILISEAYSLSTTSSMRSSNEDLMEKVERKLGSKEDESKKALNEDIVEAVFRETLGGHVDNVPKEPFRIYHPESIPEVEEVELRRPRSLGTDISVVSVTESSTHTSYHSLDYSIRNNTETTLEFHIGRTHEESKTHGEHEESLRSSSKGKFVNEDFSVEDMLASLEVVNPFGPETLENSKFDDTKADVKKDAPTSLQTAVTSVQKSVVENIFTSEEFLKDSKPPEIVGVIPKTPKDDKKHITNIGTFGNKRSPLVGRAYLDQNYDPETASISSKRSIESTSRSPLVGRALIDQNYDPETASIGSKRSIESTPRSPLVGRARLDQNYDPETTSIGSKRSTEGNSRNSVASALNALDDEISDLDENMFTGSLSKASTQKNPEVFNQIFGMHEFNSETEKSIQRNISVTSLASVNSVPWLDGTKMKKWDNTEQLNSASLNFYAVRNRWVAGDASDTESITSSNLTPAQTPLDSLPPCPLESSTPVRTKSEEKSLESTDSGIAQDTSSNTEKDEEFGFYTPPPPPILDDIQQEEESTTEINLDIKPSEQNNLAKTDLTKEDRCTATESLISGVSDKKEVAKESKEPPSLTEPVKPLISKSDSLRPHITHPVPPVVVHLEKQEPVFSTKTRNQPQSDTEIVDIDWHYQLPSPPKAFRDSSPANLVINDTTSVTDFKDSVVTSPELFEKLKTLEDSQSEKDTIKSEVTSIASEEPLNMLSLEHLEKRKSLVYNRELSTSLKMTDSLETSAKTTDNFTSSITSFQSTYDELSKASVQQSQPRKPARTTVTSSSHHTLPNFKITTYDVPKQNITVFEDDTIRSNTHATSNLTRNRLGRSMDNIAIARRASGDESSNNSNNQEREYIFYKPQTTSFGIVAPVSRSESFSTDQRLPVKPVSRSKSTLTMNKLQVSETDETISISRSNSLFDVSGLQSLEVMKLIQNKLNTPTGSIENISYKEKQQSQIIQSQNFPPKTEIRETEPARVPEPQPVEEKPRSPSPEPVKKYYYRGPPSVNMTTWSERPKVPVAVKEDEDYKLGNVNVSSKLIVNTTNNNITSNNTIEVRNNEYSRNGHNIKESENKNVSINVNGNDHISQASNNVVIKIGGTNNNSYVKNLENQRFLGPTGYRKPFSNINRNNNSVTTNQRPHSIALPSDFDISRVPVVRSVEFKKPYKDFHGSNTSITHINHGNDDYRSLGYDVDKSETFVDKFRSTENLRSTDKQESQPTKRVFRVSSFKPVENNSGPVIRGFRPVDRDVNHRLSWNPSSTYNTLPTKPKPEKEFVTNQHVPFSQSTLKRTTSSKIYTADQNSNDLNKPDLKESKNYADDHTYNSLPSTILHNNKLKLTTVPPPPPQMPKVALKKVTANQDTKNQSNPTDARDMLLDSIRNFGGKKGLRAVKA